MPFSLHRSLQPEKRCDLFLAPDSILLLERGDWLRREAQNWSAESVFVPRRRLAKCPCWPTFAPKHLVAPYVFVKNPASGPNHRTAAPIQARRIRDNR